MLLSDAKLEFQTEADIIENVYLNIIYLTIGMVDIKNNELTIKLA